MAYWKIACGVILLLFCASEKKTFVHIDDTSNTNSVCVKQILQPMTSDEICQIVKKETKLCISGSKCSMNGCNVLTDELLLDVSKMNKIIGIDLFKKTVTVTTGTTWKELILFLNIYNHSPMVCPSYINSTIGGAVSTNCHGTTNNCTLSSSIVECKIINSDGAKYVCSNTHNSKMFSLIIGGMGSFCVIYEITLKIIPNYNMKINIKKINTELFVDNFKLLLSDKKIRAKFATINMQNSEIIKLYSFSETEGKKNTLNSSVIQQKLYDELLPFTRNILNISPAEKTDEITMNEYLNLNIDDNIFTPLKKHNITHIINEHFIPVQHFNEYMNDIKNYFSDYKKTDDCTLLKITISFQECERIAFLKYAPCDVFSFTFYFRVINTPTKGILESESISNDLINICLKYNGSFYLPYRMKYTKEQLLKAYPNFDDFVSNKKIIDKKNIFQNNWFNKNI